MGAELNQKKKLLALASRPTQLKLGTIKGSWKREGGHHNFDHITLSSNWCNWHQMSSAIESVLKQALQGERN